MTFAQFTNLVHQSENPVILIEGKRSIPEEYSIKASILTARLAREFPTLLFRSGNADGSDEAFSGGVARVDPSRLQIVAPYRGHKRNKRHQSARYLYPDDLSPEWERDIVEWTLIATPAYRSLMAARNTNPTLAAKARYIIRDTMKAAYRSEAFHTPVAALFYVNPEDPHAGGTGHTIRVCRNLGIPVLMQEDWEQW